MNIEDTFNQSGLLYDRYLGDNLQLPYSETDIKIAPNDTVTADLINLKLSNLYQNFLYLYKNTKMASTLVPISALATAGVSANDTKFTWYRGLSTSQFQPFESLGNTLSALDNFKEIFALQNADLEQYTLLCTTGTELYAINSNNAETSLAIALSTLDYNTERITDKFFVDINSFALGPDNQLLLLDRGSNLLYKYDASGFLTNDNIAANRLFFKKFIGGYGDIQAKLKFNSPESVCMSNDFIYVLDSGNSCIKKYDKYLNWQYTYTLQRDFLSSYPFKLKVDSDSNFYVLTDDMFIFKYDNDFQNRYVISLSSIQVNGEVFKDMVFSSYDPNIFYVVTDQNVYKKFTSKPDDTTGKYLFYLHKFNNTQTLKAFVSLKATDGDNNILYSKNNDTAIFTSFYDNANLYDILTIPDFDVYDLEEIKLKEQENVQSWVLNKTFSKMILNHMRLRDQIIGKFVYILDARGNLVFNFNRYLTETEKDTINYQSNITSFVGKNEIIQNSVLNRCLVTVHKFQASILEVLREELKKELNKLVLLGAWNTVDTLSDLRNLQATTIQNVTNTIYVNRHDSLANTGGGDFVYDSLSMLADDDGAIIKPNSVGPLFPGRWIRQLNGNAATPEMWGARGDGITNDQPAIQRAIRYTELNAPYKLLFDCKTYLLTSYPMVQSDPFGTPIMPDKYWQNGYWKNYAKLDHLMIGYYPNPDNNSPSCLNDSVSANIELIGTRNGSQVTTLSADCTFCFTKPTPAGEFPYAYDYRSVYSLNCSHIIGFCRNLSAVKMKDFDLIPFALSTFPPYPIYGITTDAATPYGGIVKRGNMCTTQGYNANLYSAEETKIPFRTEIMYLSGVRFINCSRGLTTGEGASLPHRGIKKIEAYKCEFLHPNDMLNVVTVAGQETLFEPGASLLLFDSITAEGISDTIYQYDGISSHEIRGEDGFLMSQGVSAVFTNCSFNKYTIETIVAGYDQSGLLAEKITIPRIGEQITVNLNIGRWRENYIPDETRGFFTWLDTVTGQILPAGKKAWVTLNGQGGGGGGTYGGNYTIDQYIAKSAGIINTLSAVMTRLSGGLTNTNTDYVRAINKQLNINIGQVFNNAWIYPYIEAGTNWVPSYTKIINSQFNRGASYINPLRQNQFTNCIISHDPACNMVGTGNYYISGCLFDQCKGSIVEEINFGYLDSKGVVQKNIFNISALTAVDGIQTYYYIPYQFSSCFGGTIFNNNSAFGPFDLEGNSLNYLPESFHQIYYNSADTWPFSFYRNASPPYLISLFSTQSHNSSFTDNTITLSTPLCAEIFKYFGFTWCNTWMVPININTTTQVNNCDPSSPYYATYSNVITGNRVVV